MPGCTSIPMRTPHGGMRGEGGAAARTQLVVIRCRDTPISLGKGKQSCS